MVADVPGRTQFVFAVRGRVTWLAMRWQHGLTTVPERRGDLLPRTLASLKAGGFDRPHLFIDGDHDGASWEREFGLKATARSERIRTAGNWMLALYELYYLDPNADRYLITQDDLVCVRNLRAYLEKSPYPEKGYLNCYSFRANETVIAGKPPGWYPGYYLGSGPPGFQKGLGAVALVFTREAVMTLLKAEHMVERPQNAHRGWKAVDGGIVTSMNKAGWLEYVHAPSLVQHTGKVSSMQNREHPLAESFPGETFDALELLR